MIMMKIPRKWISLYATYDMQTSRSGPVAAAREKALDDARDREHTCEQQGDVIEQVQRVLRTRDRAPLEKCEGRERNHDSSEDEQNAIRAQEVYGPQHHLWHDGKVETELVVDQVRHDGGRDGREEQQAPSPLQTAFTCHDGLPASS
jgi:hypothetical protein